MSGSGNDFILIDNRDSIIKPNQKREFVKKVCVPKMSVGADGVIFIENSDKADFRWDFYNSDGGSAEMCGNGGRCVARYAYEKQIAPRRKLSFETLAGIIQAEVDGKSVKVWLTPPSDFREGIEVELDGVSYSIDAVNTGVPHAVIFSKDLDDDSVRRIGSGVRFHRAFAPAGTNVNFVEVRDRHRLKVRTYERGVEGETLACGTGVVASALVAARGNRVEPPVQVETLGGDIVNVCFDESSNGSFGEVCLEGLTKTVFEGTLVEL